MKVQLVIEYPEVAQEHLAALVNSVHRKYVRDNGQPNYTDFTGAYTCKLFYPDRTVTLNVIPSDPPL